MQNQQAVEGDGVKEGRALSSRLLQASGEQDIATSAPCMRCHTQATHVREVELPNRAGEPIAAVIGWCDVHYAEARTLAQAMEEPCALCRNPFCDGTECYEDA